MTKERLIQLFMFEPTHGKYLMSFEYRKQSYKESKKALNELKKEGVLFERSKNRTTVVFEYVPKSTSIVISADESKLDRNSIINKVKSINNASN